jgi:hypothetical protein
MKTPEIVQHNVPLENREIKGISIRLAIGILGSLASTLIAGALWYSSIMNTQAATVKEVAQLKQEFADYKLLKATEENTRRAENETLKLQVNTLETILKLK